MPTSVRICRSNRAPHASHFDADHVGPLFLGGSQTMGALVQTTPRYAPTPPAPSSPRIPVSPRPRRESGRITGVPIQSLTSLRASDSPSQRRIVESGSQGPNPKNHSGTRFSLNPLGPKHAQNLMRVGFRALALKKSKFFAICSLTMPSSICTCRNNSAPHASQRCGPCGANFFRQTSQGRARASRAAISPTPRCPAPRSPPAPPPPPSPRTPPPRPATASRPTRGHRPRQAPCARRR